MVEAAPMTLVRRAAKYGFCSGVRVADIKVRRFAREGGSGAILGQVHLQHAGVREQRTGESNHRPTDVLHYDTTKKLIKHETYYYSICFYRNFDFL